MSTIDRRVQGKRRLAGHGSFALATVVAAALLFGAAAVAAAQPRWLACLACHGEAGLSMSGANGERIPLAVSAAELGGSAHRGLECRACHPGVQLDAHPRGVTLKNREAYRTAASGICLTCHPAQRLRERAPHAAVVFEDQQLRCVECHGSHGIRPVAAWKQGVTPNEYCLACHARGLTLQRPDGSALELAVDPAKLAASVHPQHACVDCHAGYSTSAHPAGALGERRDHALAAAKTCGRCHEDKLRQAEGSIHFTLLRSGSAAAPGCTDCHSAHAVAPKERYATLTGTPCRGCHAQIFAAYAESMHGTARVSGEHLEAPLCSDCHRAHDVQGSARPELVRAACLGCHPAAQAAHEAWLPNAALHLQAVSCAACHAPKGQRVVALRLMEQGTGRTLTEREVGELLGGSALRAFDPSGAGVNGLDLWKGIRELEKRRQSPTSKLQVVGRLELAHGTDAHRLAAKGDAIRSCESCHRSGSPAFERVALSLARDDGRPRDFAGSPQMLAEAGALLAVPGFYALGGTRSVVLDWLLLLALAGGLAVVGAHLSVRLWTARSRKEG